MKLVKRLIRWMYWRYAHDGDPWQCRLMLYHLGRIVKTGQDEKKNMTVGTLVLAQVEEQINEACQRASKMNKVFECEITGIGAVRE